MSTYRNGILVEPEEGYNGWTNYPTWAVKLWIDNDEGSYNYWREQANAWLTTSTQVGEQMSGVQDAEYELADQLKDEHEEGYELERVAMYRNLAAHEVDATVYSDLMGYALGCVNWHEIAESLISEAQMELREKEGKA